MNVGENAGASVARELWLQARMHFEKPLTLKLPEAEYVSICLLAFDDVSLLAGN